MRIVRPVVLLRIEAFIVFIAAVAIYRYTGGLWLHFALLFFVPDISIPFYWLRRDLGCALYNLAHTYTWPLALLLLTVVGNAPLWVRPYALIWIAHIAWDRQFAFGLKLADNFWETHLGTIQGGQRLWQRVSVALRS
jgi:hypothetical protein